MRLLRVLLLSLIALPAIATQPTKVSVTTSTFSDAGNTNETAGGVSWQTSDRVLVFGGVSDGAIANQLATPTVTGGSGTGLTFSLSTAVNNSGATDSQVYLWTATAAGNGSGTIQSVSSAAGSLRGGIVVYVFRGSTGLGTPVSLDNSTAKTISVTRAQANSHVVVLMSDYLAVGDATVTATPTGTVDFAESEAGQADYFAVSFDDQGATGTTAYGITNHTGTVDMSGLAVEIKGTASGSTLAIKRRRH